MKTYTFHFIGNGLDFQKNFLSEDKASAWLLAVYYMGRMLGTVPNKIELIQE